jgi:hypothetical protein
VLAMNSIAKFAILAIASGLVIGTTFMTIPVAAEDHARKGLNIADEKIHDNTVLGSDQDFRFHEGICQGGHSTDVLDQLTGGQGCDALNSPGGR